MDFPHWIKPYLEHFRTFLTLVTSKGSRFIPGCYTASTFKYTDFKGNTGDTNFIFS